MSYLDIYRRKMKIQGGNIVGSDVKSTEDYVNIEFKNDPSYREASLNLYNNNKVDIRIIEDKADLFRKYFLFRPNYKISKGSYIEVDGKHFIIENCFLKDVYPKAEALMCNIEIMVQGQSRPIPAYGNNTTYGTKGLRDNGYFKEHDAKLKIFVQANDETRRYFEGMRLLIKVRSNHMSNNKEFVAYQIAKKDFVVLDGVYVLETELTSVSPLDDLENGIAYNERFGNIEEYEECNIIGSEKIKVGSIYNYKLQPEKLDVIYELDNENYATIVEESNNECKVRAIKSQGVITLLAKKNQNILSKKDIIIY